MKPFTHPFAILALAAACAFSAPAGAEIQMATSEMNNADARAAGREFKDMMKFARENEPARDGMTGDGVQSKKHGSLDVSKLSHNRAHSPAAIGKGIGGHANDGDEER